MKRISLLLGLVLVLLGCQKKNEPIVTDNQKIGLCVVATGKYIQFIPQLVESAKKYFCTNHQVTIFVFTDQPYPEEQGVVRIEQARLGWPHDSLKRFHIYDAHSALLSEMDYLFAIDADAYFAGSIGNEILSNRVFTQHPGYVNKKGMYEKKKTSSAYVRNKDFKSYLCGGFYGGKRDYFFDFLHKVIELVDADLAKGYIAKWHDESYLNRFCIDHPPSLILSPAYCYPADWSLPYEKKVVVITKDHEEMRAL